jgi:hypothetical protein
VGQASRLSSETTGNPSVGATGESPKDDRQDAGPTQDARPTGNLVGAHGDAPFLDSHFHGNDGRLLPSHFSGVAMTVRQLNRYYSRTALVVDSAVFRALRQASVSW